MLEISLNDALTGTLIPSSTSFGGDTLNTAVYLSRLGVSVDYISAVGDDDMSNWMVEQWRSEGIGCETVQRYADAPPGLYLIQIDENGERSFLYWREGSAARCMLSTIEKVQIALDKVDDYDALYLSGITLALCSDEVRQYLFEVIATFRQNGGTMIFDDNYRARLWPNHDDALSVYESMYRLTDIALPTIDDELELFGDADEEAVVARLRSCGIKELALKKGPRGCLLVNEFGTEMVPAQPMGAVDTTAAGDSFNAGYIAARFSGKTPCHAAKAAHQLASVVVQHQGAIIPLRAMPG